MSRYIDAEHFDERVRLAVGLEGANMTDDFKDGIQSTLLLLRTEPTADVVEVVRCKDCKFRKIEFGWNGKRYKMCANTDYPTDDYAYCSYGERREDEQIH